MPYQQAAECISFVSKEADWCAVAGECSAPAYLANVCVAKAAHRQGIGRRLVDNARTLAVGWGVSSTLSLY